MKENQMLVFLSERETTPKGRCKDCAFRHGTDANNDPHAVELALDAIANNHLFFCHTTDFKPENHLCRGYVEAAVQHRKMCDEIENTTIKP